MWAATTDFMKAFDSITPKSILDALKSSGIEHEYIHLLRKLYKDQKATGYEFKFVQDGIGKFYDADSRKTKTAGVGRTDELQCLPHFSSCCFSYRSWHFFDVLHRI